ncbi:MAG: xanthine dehydrogenase family protein molybdopterin-binding subunit [Pseudomonadota bacterium]|nr:xanthine dehydrogenase family protein molybdopterin-binding subunit [Pseudomonadota bacterium]
MSGTDPTNPQGVGGSPLRKEDARHLAGRGRFVGDIGFERGLEAAIIRSPVAHGMLKGVDIGDVPTDCRVFTEKDFPDIKPIRAVPRIPGFKASDFPIFATDKVRYVGQPIGICVAPTAAEAEDIARQVILEIEELPAIINTCEAATQTETVLHESWGDNVFIQRDVQGGDIEAARSAAVVTVTNEFRLNRHAAIPLESRAVLAVWDNRRDELTLNLSSQGPHLMRVGIAECLGLRERQLRVISPDVGGGFGSKNRLMPEEVMVCAASLKTGRPVRWLEDRRENITANNQAREHWYRITAYADGQGVILGIEAELIVDAGSYSIWPSGPFMETGMAARNLPGPYRIPALSVKTWTVATNKPPLGPYRGVARPGACFAIERTLDEVARKVGRDPYDVRRENMVAAHEMPFTGAGGMRFDNGDYPKSVEKAAEAADMLGVRARQSAGAENGRLIGIGFGSYSEQTAHGTQEWKIRGTPVIPAFETATARMHADGTLELMVGIHSHGQGMETTLAQVACQELGVELDDVVVRYGDTAVGPYGNGTFASRSMVMSGGASASACRKLAGRIKEIGAHLLQCRQEDVELRDSAVFGDGGSISVAEIARTAHIRQDLLPDDVEPTLEETAVYQPEVTSGVFSYSTHAAVVLVDPDTGEIELENYAVAEDCGTIVNPMIVDGQIYGGVAQGIGTALFEEIPYDEYGQPLASTFADYHWPGSSSLPSFRVTHMVTPAEGTEYGMKGMGEGGAIAPPAAIANAVRDALLSGGIDAEIGETPMSPRRIYAAIQAACKTNENA